MPLFEALVINPDDNVATLIVDGRRGDVIRVRLNASTLEIALRSDVRFGHKCSIRRIAAGENVVKYGKPIGVATRDIDCGDHVHVHNVQGVRAQGRGGV